MPTAITIGNLGGIIACLLFSALYSPATVLRFADFETQNLGDFPTNVFAGGWGSINHGRSLYVTNLRAFESQRSLCIKNYPKRGMFGLGIPIKQTGERERGVFTVEFDFFRETNESGLGAEFRSSDGKKWPWGISWGAQINGFHKKQNKELVCELNTMRWYHLTFVFPVTKDDPTPASLAIRDSTTGEEWKQVWEGEKMGRWYFTRPQTGITLCLNMNSGTYGNVEVLYLDNLKVSFQESPISDTSSL